MTPLLFFAGLILCMTDGPMFPALNAVGLLVCFGVALKWSRYV